MNNAYTAAWHNSNWMPLLICDATSCMCTNSLLIKCLCLCVQGSVRATELPSVPETPSDRVLSNLMNDADRLKVTGQASDASGSAAPLHDPLIAAAPSSSTAGPTPSRLSRTNKADGSEAIVEDNAALADHMQSQLSDAIAAHEEVQAAYDSLQQHKAELEQQVAQLTAALTEQQAQSSKAQSALTATLAAQLSELHDAYDSLKDERDKLAAEAEATQKLTQQLQELQAAHGKLTSQHESVEAEVQGLLTDNEKLAEELAVAQAVGGQMQTLKSDMQQLQSDRDQLLSDKQALQSDIQSLQSDNEHLQQQISHLQSVAEEVQRLQAAYDDLMEQNKQLALQLTHARLEISQGKPADDLAHTVGDGSHHGVSAVRAATQSLLRRTGSDHEVGVDS